MSLSSVLACVTLSLAALALPDDARARTPLKASDSGHLLVSVCIGDKGVRFAKAVELFGPKGTALELKRIARVKLKGKKSKSFARIVCSPKPDTAFEAANLPKKVATLVKKYKLDQKVHAGPMSPDGKRYIILSPQQEKMELYLMEGAGTTWSHTIPAVLSEDGGSNDDTPESVEAETGWHPGHRWVYVAGTRLTSSYPVKYKPFVLARKLSDPLAEDLDRKRVGALLIKLAKVHEGLQAGGYPRSQELLIGPVTKLALSFDPSNLEARYFGAANGLGVQHLLYLAKHPSPRAKELLAKAANDPLMARLGYPRTGWVPTNSYSVGASFKIDIPKAWSVQSDKSGHLVATRGKFRIVALTTQGTLSQTEKVLRSSVEQRARKEGHKPHISSEKVELEVGPALKLDIQWRKHTQVYLIEPKPQFVILLSINTKKYIGHLVGGFVVRAELREIAKSVRARIRPSLAVSFGSLTGQSGVGSVDKNAVETALRKKAEQLAGCATRLGKLNIRFKLSTAGRVSSASKTHDTADVSKTCLSRVLRAARFPKTIGGSVSFSVELNFTPKKRRGGAL